MSYCRFAVDCDVYLYEGEGSNGQAAIVCCGCKLPVVPSVKGAYRGYFETDDGWEMLRHLADHAGLGHQVPTYAASEILAEMQEEGWWL